MVRKSIRSGFSLVEVTLALGVAGFCLIAIFGLLPVGFNSNRTAMEQTAAAGIARAMVSDLRAMNPGDTASAIFKIAVPASGGSSQTIFLTEDGVPTATQTQANPAENPRYRATLVFTVSPATTQAFGSASTLPTQGKATFVRIWITWPALADKVAASKPTNYSGSYETFTALDRN